MDAFSHSFIDDVCVETTGLSVCVFVCVCVCQFNSSKRAIDTTSANRSIRTDQQLFSQSVSQFASHSDNDDVLLKVQLNRPANPF